MAMKPVSVTQLNEYISRVLMTDPLLGNITVIGEVSNLKSHSTGHVYFSITDQNSKINCFFPASYVRNTSFELCDGMEVIINGYINVYKKGGTYTLFVRSVQVSGEGSLAVAFQVLKERLDKEGLFDNRYKKEIPAFPHKIGIITSPTGAAVQDIIKILSGRTSLTDVKIFPVLVQGKGAAEDIAHMIDFVNETFDDIDTLIVGRGGGSTEDLWAFNEEIVARAIFRSRIPIISAVGHEIDFTISDFVADKRAETPTAAAEMAVPDMKELMLRCETLKTNLLRQLESKVRYDKLSIDRYITRIESALEKKLTAYSNQLERCRLLLDENNPKKVMQKGYSILNTEDNCVVSSISQLQENKYYRVQMKDGSADFLLTNLSVKKEV